jgi:hypothetical protein
VTKIYDEIFSGFNTNVSTELQYEDNGASRVLFREVFVSIQM